jgi:hypothetical protein
MVPGQACRPGTSTLHSNLTIPIAHEPSDTTLSCNRGLLLLYKRLENPDITRSIIYDTTDTSNTMKPILLKVLVLRKWAYHYYSEHKV